MGQDITGKKILVVDDEPDVVTYVTTFLQDQGFDTCSATNGEEGLEKAKAEKPHLIALDISMPQKSGVKMLRQLQEDPATTDIPVIVVTGISSEFKQFISSRKGIMPPAGYIEKPIDRDVLLQTIRDVLQA